jgi:hypothetical protein
MKKRVIIRLYNLFTLPTNYTGGGMKLRAAILIDFFEVMMDRGGITEDEFIELKDVCRPNYPHYEVEGVMMNIIYNQKNEIVEKE